MMVCCPPSRNLHPARCTAALTCCTAPPSQRHIRPAWCPAECPDDLVYSPSPVVLPPHPPSRMYVPPGVPLPLPEGQPLTSLVMTQALQDFITPDIALVSEVPGQGSRGGEEVEIEDRRQYRPVVKR